jgi:hypothetical protein
MFLVSVALSANEHDEAVHKMLESSGLSINYKDIESGKTVVIAREDQEKTDSSIALSMVLYVKAPYKKVLQTIKKGEGRLSGYKDSKRIGIKDIKNLQHDFSNIGFTDGEMDEVEKLFAYNGDNTFNLSEDEIKKLKILIKKSHKTKREIASSFYQEILKDRLEAYLENGINGISAYEHSSKGDTVEDGFKKSSFGMSVFRNKFPDMYKDYMNYPKDKAKDIKDRFFIIKDKIDGRVAFILKHQMLKKRENLILIAERQFYISSSLDAIQTQILCTPYKNGTLVTLSSQSYTDKVAGFGRSVAIKIGRHMMEKQIRPMFDDLEKRFNK